MEHFVYILKSLSAERYYIGASQDPEKRLFFHNTTEKGFTARHRPRIIVWKFKCPSKKDAAGLEKKIKSWKSIKMIDRLIDGDVKIE